MPNIYIYTTFEQYVVMATRRTRSHRNWRLGQCFFNTLTLVRPQLAEQVRGSLLLDPFHKDDKLTNFLEFVSKHWNDEYTGGNDAKQ